ncbi:MAG: tyrosine-type recombinase/integrase [Melioribacteraceae bacterium]|nr:MAG: tyrosine-type recombinase/integrase [Melioribacteraceae bacterium]
MGAIKKTKAGSFQASAYDERGVRHRQTFKKQSEAQAFINKLEAVKYDRKLVGAKLKRSRISLNIALDDYMITKAGLAKKTLAKYEFAISTFKVFLTSLNLVYVDQFTPDHGALLFKLLIQGNDDENGETKRAKPKTINQFLQIVRSFFKLEVEKGHIDRSPMLHVKNLKEEKPRPEYYSEDELKAFFAVDMPESYKNAFMGLLHTGMRINELANLTWDDVDLNRRLVHVRSKEGFSTKTDNSERSIPINDTLYSVLQRITSSPMSKTYPFCSITGKKLSDRRLLEASKEIGKSANIKGRVFLHKFRHTFATHLVKKRVPIEAVQKLMGHASILETMVYTHVRTEDLHSDVALLNSLGQPTVDESGALSTTAQIFDILTGLAA